MGNVKVTKCSNCPFFYQESEYPSSYCQLAKKDLWPMGYYKNEKEAPPGCPLRKEDYTISLTR